MPAAFQRQRHAAPHISKPDESDRSHGFPFANVGEKLTGSSHDKHARHGG
jgi:hypothetical protein